MKAGILFSGGKDSCYALYKATDDVKCLISIIPERDDSYMYHPTDVSLVKFQALALNLPIIIQHSKAIKEKELQDLEKALEQAKKEYGIEGIYTGAIASNYQKTRIEKICKKLNLKCINPLWGQDQEDILKEMIKEFDIRIIKIAAEGFTKEFLGKRIDEKTFEKLKQLKKKFKINVAAEGGEYESVVLNGPIFKKRILIKKAKKIMESNNVGSWLIEEVEIKS